MAKLTMVQVKKTRHGTYALHFTTPDGRRRRLSVGSDEWLAQRQAVRFTDWLLDGKDPEREIEHSQRVAKQQAITVREFFPIFIERHGQMQSKSMQRRYGDFHSNFSRCPTLMDLAISRVTKGMIQEYMHLRMQKDHVKPATVNREFACIRGMLERAVEWDYLDRNPLAGMRKLKENGKRDVAITPAQLTALLQELTPEMAAIVQFAVYTGFRKENILALHTDEVTLFALPIDSNEPAGKVTMQIKGNRSETFPLSAKAVAILTQSLGDRKEGYFFLNPRTTDRFKTISYTFRKKVRAHGLTVLQNGEKVPLRFHDLRHVFVTWLANSGVPRDVVRDLVGHQSETTTALYATVDRMRAGRVLSLIPDLQKAS